MSNLKLKCMRKLIGLFVFLTFVGMQICFAQTREITGTVIDKSDKSPLPGVSVIIKNNRAVGTATNVDGKYSIKVNENDVLIFTFVGMKDQEIAVAGKNVVNVEMVPATEALDEVVVMGYGAQKKGTVTGAVGVVDGNKIKEVPTASFDQILQGKATGMQVVASSGRPGAGAIVKMRGISSINASSSPLYVIDNVPVASADFNALNPGDIESVSVLKDASATSIYGSRGANGVIMITTKRGRMGKTIFNVKGQWGFSTRTRDKNQMMNTKEKLTYERQLGVGYGASSPTTGKPMTDEEINNYPINTDWMKEVFRTGKTQLYELSASGGSESTKFYLSGQYFDQEAIAPGSYLKRYTFRVNLDHKISRKLKFGMTASVGTSKEGNLRNDRNVLNPFNYVYSVNPYTKPFNEDGSWASDPTWDYGLNIFENIAMNPSYSNLIKGIGSFTLEYNIIDDLRFVSTAGVDYSQVLDYQYNKPESKLSQVLQSPGFRADSYAHRATFIWTNMLKYAKTFNDVHNLSATVGTEAQKSQWKGFGAQGEGFSSGRIDALDKAAKPLKVTGNVSDWRLLSFFALAAYDFDSRYFVDASVRSDGSSRFGKDNQYGTFWSAGAGWNIHNESFAENSGWLNQFKIRGSVGTSGNNNIGDYDALGLFSTGSYNGTSTIYPSRLPNNQLTWEKNFQASVGFDSKFFNERLTVVFDWYNRKTIDMLLAANLSLTSGFASRKENIGEMRNRGIEVSVSGDVYRSSDFFVNLYAMVSHNKNEVLKLYKGNDIKNGWNNVISEGKELNVYKMVRWAGVNPVNGDALYYTKDGQLTNKYSEDDAVILDGKSPYPDFYGSFGTNISYKGLDFSADFYFSHGNYIYNHVAFFNLSDGANANSNQDKRLLYDQWMKPGDITNIPRQDKGNSQVMSTRYLEDASYLRLRNVSLGYSFPKHLLDKVKLSKLRVYAQGLNLVTWTGFTGIDPEVGNVTSGTGPASSNADFQFPASRTIMFGLEIGF